MKILPNFPEFVGFQTMVILDPYGMSFDAVGVFGPVFQFLFESDSSYFEGLDTGVSHDQVMEYDFNTNKYTEITKINGGLAAHGCTGFITNNGNRFLVTVGGHVNSVATSEFPLFFYKTRSKVLQS